MSAELDDAKALLALHSVNDDAPLQRKVWALIGIQRLLSDTGGRIAGCIMALLAEELDNLRVARDIARQALDLVAARYTQTPPTGLGFLGIVAWQQQEDGRLLARLRDLAGLEQTMSDDGPRWVLPAVAGRGDT